MKPEFAALMILVIPLIGAALVPIINLFSRKAVPFFAVITGLVSAVIALYLPFGIKSGTYFSFEWLPGILNVGLMLDALSVMPALIATWIGLLVLIYSLGYMKHEENLARYYSLTLLFIGSMVGMSLADNFVSLFFFWEVMGVCSYLLIGFFYKDPKAAAAGVKAFIVTRIGDVGLLIAIFMLYIFSGTFGIQQNIGFISNLSLRVLMVVSFGFIIGAVGKSAQVPLHVWLPDAMEAPTTISALIHAATMVNAGVYLLARVSPILTAVPVSLVTVQWIGSITALLAAFLAVFNFDLKRILAYSTVSQLGYMFFAIGCGGVFVSQFHLFSHAIFKALLFLCAGAVIHELGSRDIRDMGGLQKKMPLTGTAFLIGALALMGMPVLNGFFSKDMILEEALTKHIWGPLALAVLAAILTAFYSIRTTLAVFWGDLRTNKHIKEAPVSMTLPLILLAVGSLFSWVLIGPLTAAWKNSGLEAATLNWKELVIETFSSGAFLMTCAAIILGFALYLTRRTILNFLQRNIPGLFKATSSGLGFDIVFNKMVGVVYAVGRNVRNFWEEQILENTNKAAGFASVTFSEVSRKFQTGDVHWNLLYIVAALIVILGFLL